MPELTPVDVPELTDGEVRLRRQRDEDIPGLVEFGTDLESLRWTTNIPTPYTKDTARSFLATNREAHAAGTDQYWTIEVDGQFAGTINLSHRGPGLAELGYGVCPGLRSRGITTRAARLVVDFAFNELELEQVQWRAALGNFASRRVAWRLGFQTDAIWPRGHLSSSGDYVDDLVMGHLGRESTRRPAHPWWEPNPLEANGIRLRPWREEDRPTEEPDDVARHFIVSRTMLPTPSTFDAWLTNQRAKMAAGKGVFWCVADADTDASLGGIEVNGLDSQVTRGSGSVGYWLTPAARGRGVLSVALELVIPHAFATRTDLAGTTGLGLHRLWAGTDEQNRPSQRALRRAGFREVLTEQQVLTHGADAPRGAVSFELLKSDDRGAQRVLPAPTTVLETARLRLRPWRASDVPTELPDAEALANMPARAMPTPDTWEAWFTRSARRSDIGVHDFCLADSDTDKALGRISIFNVDHAVGHGELGYWLYPSARGAGYLDEAIAAALEHAFEPMESGGIGLNRVRAETNLLNYSSRAALLRNGFRRWGEDHQAYLTGDGQLCDGAYYELLKAWRDEWPAGLTVPVIDGERICLRPWRMSDAPRVVEAASDADTQRWLPAIPRDYTDATARAYIHSTREDAAAGKSITWCVADRQSDLPLAALELGELRGPRHRTASVGYWAHPGARGRGVVTEGVRLALGYAFAPADAGGLDRRRAVLVAADENAASRAVARKIGFTERGTDRHAELLGDGTLVDVVRCELLREDFLAQ